MRSHGVLCWLLLTSVLRADGDPPRSPASDQPAAAAVRTPLPVNDLEGLPIALVFYDLLGSSGMGDDDKGARVRIERATGFGAGDAFSLQAAEAAMQRLKAMRFVRTARYRVYESDRAGHLAVAITVEMGAQSPGAPPQGVLAGRAADFPVLWETDSAQVRLLLDGGFGAYADVNPWFGSSGTFARSPVALAPADGGAASWGEVSAEYGLSAISRVRRTPFWVYGAGTFLTSFSAGQDLFRDDAREMTRLEDLYGGFLMTSPEGDWTVNFSAGRQNWQLHDGFLFSRFAAGANAGPYPALYLNPRTAYEMTVLGSVKWRSLKLEGFYVDPAEIDYLDSNSTYLGAHLDWTSPMGIEASLLFYEVPESDTVFAAPDGGMVPRDGLRTVDLRVGSARAFGVRGLELFGEHAWQTNRHADWSASAWYVRAGYTFANLPGRPNLSYRYASFSGDDPDTATWERFDAQLSSGLDTWVQGVSAKKVVSNANLNSHRLRLNIAPAERLNITADYFWLLADAGPGSGSLYAQEVNLAFRWTISRNLFFLGVAGLTMPGRQLRERAGSDLRNWGTIQTSLFWNL